MYGSEVFVELVKLAYPTITTTKLMKTIYAISISVISNYKIAA